MQCLSVGSFGLGQSYCCVGLSFVLQDIPAPSLLNVHSTPRVLPRQSAIRSSSRHPLGSRRVFSYSESTLTVALPQSADIQEARREAEVKTAPGPFRHIFKVGGLWCQGLSTGPLGPRGKRQSWAQGGEQGSQSCDPQPNQLDQPGQFPLVLAALIDSLIRIKQMSENSLASERCV